MSVQELIEGLSKFNPKLPVVIRQGEGTDGAYSDWAISIPSEFYPGGKVCLMRKDPHNDDEIAESCREYK